MKYSEKDFQIAYAVWVESRKAIDRTYENPSDFEKAHALRQAAWDQYVDVRDGHPIGFTKDRRLRNRAYLTLV
jgi:hypothetical protein